MTTKTTSQKLQKQLEKVENKSLLKKLSTGRAYTSVELAKAANATKATTEKHLSNLIDNDILMKIERRKRSYYRIFNEEVAQALQKYFEETEVEESKQEEKKPPGMKYCRTCYNHLAGRIGVLLTERLMEKELLKIGEDGHFIITAKGKSFFEEFGLDTVALHQKHSLFAKACIDFSERKYHLGGTLGKALFEKMFALAWVERIETSREIKITPTGKKAFFDHFQIDV